MVDDLHLDAVPEPPVHPAWLGGPVRHSLRLHVWDEGRVLCGALSGIVGLADWLESLDAFYAQGWGRITCLDVSRAVLALPPPTPHAEGAVGPYEAIVASAGLLLPTHRIDQPSCFIAEGEAQLQLLRPLALAISVLSFECVVFELHQAAVARAFCKAASEQPWPESHPKQRRVVHGRSRDFRPAQ